MNSVPGVEESNCTRASAVRVVRASEGGFIRAADVGEEALDVRQLGRAGQLRFDVVAAIWLIRRQ